MKKKKAEVSYFDYSLLAVVIFLTCFGLVMLYSSSSYNAQVNYGDSMYFFKRQSVFICGGFLLMLIASRIPFEFYAKTSKGWYALSIVLMLLVLSPLGIESYGARRWLRLPFGLQFQPSEVAKLAMILLLPYLICKGKKQIMSWKGVLKLGAVGAFLALCVYLLTDNLSTALIVAGITAVQIFVMHPKTKPFLAVVAVGSGICIFGLRMLRTMAIAEGGDFRLSRILVWLNPEQYSDSGGYQILQALYAIGSGGFFGKGLGASVQKRVIPEVQNDMILSIICEELGVFGAMIVLALFALLLYRLLFIAQNVGNLYTSLVVTGIFAHIALQVFLNVAVVINLIPTTGITLPFISYGGTSVLFLMTEMGIALGASRSIKLKGA